MDLNIERAAHGRGEHEPVAPSSPGQPVGLERELGELRREVLEARNLVIKSDNVLRGLHAEIKVLGKRHEEMERRSFVASGFAYGGFVLLAALGAAVAARAYVSSAREEATRVEAQAATLSVASQTIARKAEAGQAASAEAADIYARMAGDPAGQLEAAAAAAALDRSRLSPLESRALDDRANLVRRELATKALERGRAAFRRNDMKVAATELGNYFKVADPTSADIAASFDFGNALWQQKAYLEAVPQLQRFLKLGKGLKNQDYAELLLGEALDQLGRKEEAANAFRRGLLDHPTSEFSPQFRHRLAKLAPPKPHAASIQKP